MVSEAPGHHDRRRRRRNVVGASGLALLVVGQVLILAHYRPFSDYWYGILWTGFVLVADAIVDARDGGSLVLDRPRELAAMFAASAILWWGLELANVLLLGSWRYSPSPDVPRWVQALRSTYFFATLLPSTWLASALALSLARVAPAAGSAPGWTSLLAALVGLGSLGGAFAFPAISLPLVLIGAGLLLDAINARRGRPSLLGFLGAGRVGPVFAIAFGNVVAGVIGEAWNFRADPRWTYQADYAGKLRLFAMPLPGFAGYAALAFVLFSFYHLVRPQLAGRAFAAEHPFSVLGTGA